MPSRTRVELNDHVIHDIMEEICSNATTDEEYYSVCSDMRSWHNFCSRTGCVTYSRSCKGGAYVNAFNYIIYDDTKRIVIIPIERSLECGWKYGDDHSENLNNPDSLNNLTEYIKTLFSRLQLDRNPRQLGLNRH